ncbi:MAG: TIGR04211 family SH3 domain-containing protein [Gammaproteobacteria bacterium]|nr:TIGR04211 family SH3 domain-containing protein [Gammaproteobacteria bacterium]
MTLLVRVLLLLLLASPLYAQTRYVSDNLVITFRSGPSNQNSILRNLTSGDRVEVLEEQADAGYARVRLDDGAEGWVLMQYLQPEPTSALRLAEAESELATLRQTAARQQQRVSELEAELSAVTGRAAALETENSAANAELADIRAASRDALETRDRNTELLAQVADLRSQADIAALEIAELESRSRQNWFILGAAVLFGGIVIGLVAPSLRPRRKSSW